MGYIEDHARDASILKWDLIELLFTAPLRIATCDFAVTAFSNIFTARPCKVLGISAQGGMMNSGAVEIADADNVVVALLRASNGGEGVEVNIWEAWFAPTNKTNLPDATRLRAAGKIDSADKDSIGGNETVVINLVGAGKGSNVYVPPRLVAALTK